MAQRVACADGLGHQHELLSLLIDRDIAHTGDFEQALANLDAVLQRDGCKEQTSPDFGMLPKFPSESGIWIGSRFFADSRLDVLLAALDARWPQIWSLWGLQPSTVDSGEQKNGPSAPQGAPRRAHP